MSSSSDGTDSQEEQSPALPTYFVSVSFSRPLPPKLSDPAFLLDMQQTCCRAGVMAGLEADKLRVLGPPGFAEGVAPCTEPFWDVEFSVHRCMAVLAAHVGPDEVLMPKVVQWYLCTPIARPLPRTTMEEAFTPKRPPQSVAGSAAPPAAADPFAPAEEKLPPADAAPTPAATPAAAEALRTPKGRRRRQSQRQRQMRPEPLPSSSRPDCVFGAEGGCRARACLADSQATSGRLGPSAKVAIKRFAPPHVLFWSLGPHDTCHSGGARRIHDAPGSWRASLLAARFRKSSLRTSPPPPHTGCAVAALIGAARTLSPQACACCCLMAARQRRPPASSAARTSCAAHGGTGPQPSTHA